LFIHLWYFLLHISSLSVHKVHFIIIQFGLWKYLHIVQFSWRLSQDFAEGKIILNVDHIFLFATISVGFRSIPINFAMRSCFLLWLCTRPLIYSSAQARLDILLFHICHCQSTFPILHSWILQMFICKQ